MSDYLWYNYIDCVCTCQNEAGKDELEQINLGTCQDRSLQLSQALNHEL